MKTVVLKFGGTSVGSIDRIKKVCKIIASYKRKKNKVVVVSSAMSGATNDLVSKSKLISGNFDKAEYDTLLSTGEQVSCALIAGRLINNGFKSRSWMSWQLPIITDGPYSAARINKVFVNNLNDYLKSGGIPVITGFQGINNKFRITTIGRSGSDATAIMLAKFIKADECIIYTDVDGVYTTDPRQYKNAKKIQKIFYDEMLEMASLGSKVMQPTSVQDAKLNKIDIQVKSSFVTKSGTLITGSSKAFSDQIITGISSTKNDAKITIVGVKDRPGVAASIFKPLSQNSINVDMVVQNISLNGKDTDLTFTIKSEDLKKSEKLIKQNKKISYKKLSFDKDMSKVSIIGVGMITTPGITYRMFQALASKKINILVISTSEIKISVLISTKQVKKAIAALHKEFKLD
ncbi:aspartate kinase [Candidatus Pelagibacter sp.]|jgi:aspartate kinase|nr:aspartate kinase [Candidatus Pelagibacter sp.]MDB3895193.1 aspartate kinase [Candidatus Pelagibacter sp.]MDB9923207.1 aspartate kinase [Candidatus Pelagibacter sp.]|tara:strand:- start:378 stop:1589 length:1212 start_codon:yes stop_codon:yes gene_type:complete